MCSVDLQSGAVKSWLFETLKAQGLKLDLTRGKPAPDQLLTDVYVSY